MTDTDRLEIQLLLEAINRLEGKLDNLSTKIHAMESTMTGQIAQLSEKVASLQKEKEQLFAFHNDREKTISRLFEELKDVNNTTANNARAMEGLNSRMGEIESKLERGIADDMALKRKVELREAEQKAVWNLPIKLGGLAAAIMAIVALVAWISGE